jgi:hypothetical protein
MKSCLNCEFLKVGARYTHWTTKKEVVCYKCEVLHKRITMRWKGHQAETCSYYRGKKK